MVRLARIGVVMAVVAIGGLAASSAAAVEWHTNGDRAFTTTNAGAVRLVFHHPGGLFLIECASATGSGTLTGPTRANGVFVGVATMTPAFGGPCTVSGTPGFTVSCSPAYVNGLSYVGGTTIATAGGGVTTGSITSIDCVVGSAGTTCSTITGSVQTHYINPNPIATGVGLLTLTAAGQSLGVHKIGAGCGILPDGVATVGKPGVGSTITDITYSLDGPNAPYMYRTP